MKTKYKQHESNTIGRLVVRETCAHISMHKYVGKERVCVSTLCFHEDLIKLRNNITKALDVLEHNWSVSVSRRKEIENENTTARPATLAFQRPQASN